MYPSPNYKQLQEEMFEPISGSRGGILIPMRIDISEDEVILIDEALRHLAAYRVVQQRDERPLLDIAAKLIREARKPVVSETPAGRRKKAGF